MKKLLVALFLIFSITQKVKAQNNVKTFYEESYAISKSKIRKFFNLFEEKLKNKLAKKYECADVSLNVKIKEKLLYNKARILFSAKCESITSLSFENLDVRAQESTLEIEFDNMDYKIIDINV